MCCVWTNSVHKPASRTTQWEGHREPRGGGGGLLWDKSIPLVLDLGERKGITFSLKSSCQGTEPGSRHR